MSRIPDVGLLTAPVRVRAVFVFGLVFDLPIGAVVAGEDHQRVGRESGFIQSAQQASEHIVHLSHEVSVQPRL